MGNRALSERLGRLVDSGELLGERGEAVLIHLDDSSPAPRLVAVGLGRRNEVDRDALRTAGAAAADAVGRIGGTLGWVLDDELPLPLPSQAAAVVEGTILGGYSPAAWKTYDLARLSKPVERIVIAPTETGMNEEPALRTAAETAALIAEQTNCARHLANMPPNELNPEALGEIAHDLARQHEHVTCEVLRPDQLDALEMGALTAVGRGSHNEPRLVVLRYNPPSGRDDLLLGLVGKAITFDTGGISLKPALNMENMKGDMAGGAGALYGMSAIAALRLPIRAIAVLAAAENMPSGDAFRPGDILRAANGKTIEIMNTDGEGRLVLADALWYARREGATHVIDLATLTGAAKEALGDIYAGYFANDASWSELIGRAGERSGDHVWPLPLHPRFRRYIDSTFADMKNGSTLRQGAPALAAKFLEEFAGDGPWAHVDMAGPGFLQRSRGDYLRVPGGTGFGVRLIAELAREILKDARKT